MWDVRGATARPWEAKWRESQLFFGCVITKIFFKDPNDYYDVTSVLYHKDKTLGVHGDAMTHSVAA